MVAIGYALSSEEHPPSELVANAKRAEDVGFSFASISDHFHPWIDKQGHSPFVWTVLGGIAAATTNLRVGTGVTCPLIRTHPVVIAQAAATVSCMMPGRFFLGVGTGENLNEHVVGAQWPAIDTRREMLQEAVAIMRQLWTGEELTHRGSHYTVDHARIYTVPDEPPPIYVAASGERVAETAAGIGDGLIGTSPKPELIDAFVNAGGRDKPRYGMLHVCWAAREEDAKRTAYEWWPNSALPGELGQELPLPRHFEQAAENVREEDVTKVVTCGPDPDRHVEIVQKYIDAGYDHVYVHQIGPDQDGFFRFYEEKILPRVSSHATA